MQTTSRKIACIGRMFLIALVLAAILFQAGCASSYHTKKGKLGQVPCPCNKKNRRW